jgi:hypothetical protein
MEGLGDAYARRRWKGRDPRRIAAGAVVGVLGVLALVAALLIVTTPISDLFGLSDIRAAEKAAGTVGGLGVPALFLSVVVVLPSSRREQIGVCIGTLFCLIGVGLFQIAYPTKWTNGAETLAFETTMAYFIGTSLAFWFVFRAMAGFQKRNDPQGTVRIELTRQGKSKTVRVSQKEYRQYAAAIRSDGGETEQIIEELESRADE